MTCKLMFLSFVTWSSHATVKTDQDGEQPRRQPPLLDIVVACQLASAERVVCTNVTIGLVDCRLSCAV